MWVAVRWVDWVELIVYVSDSWLTLSICFQSHSCRQQARMSFIQSSMHALLLLLFFIPSKTHCFVPCFLHRFLPSYWFVCSISPACQRVLVFAETMLKVWVSSCADCCFAYVALAECIALDRVWFVLLVPYLEHVLWVSFLSLCCSFGLLWF